MIRAEARRLRCVAQDLAGAAVLVTGAASGIGRAGALAFEPEEIAEAVLWLAGTSYAAGAVLSVGGGYTAR